MANNLQTVVKMARVLAIAHIVVGALLICFGIADYLTQLGVSFFAGYIFFGVWIGVWMCVTGGLGIPGSRRERTRCRDCFVGVFMGFSITSVVMGGLIIIFYGIVIAYNSGERRSKSRYRGMYDTKMALAAIILLLGIVEFVIGIWAAICCCMMKPRACIALQQGRQVVYTASTARYLIIQGPDGNPVAVPVQAVDGIVTVQVPRSQGSQPPMVLMPSSGAVGGEPHAVEATGYPPQEVEMPSLYGHRQYTPLNEEIPVKISI